MKILVDADACPVKDVIIEIGRQKGIQVELVASYNHHINGGPGVTVITTDTGPDAADYVIANRVNTDYLVITQDYGLAALVLGRKGKALSPRGLAMPHAGVFFEGTPCRIEPFYSWMATTGITH